MKNESARIPKLGKGTRLLMVVNDAGFFLSHRLSIALAAQQQGCEIHVATALGPQCERVSSFGFTHHELPLSRSGKSILREFTSIFALFRLIRTIRPDIVHLVTIKPVLYGGIVSRLVGVNGVVSAISGLGTTFIARNLSSKLLRIAIRWLYRFALSHKNQRIIFQNPDDLQLVVDMTGISTEQCTLIRGSGVRLSDYRFEPEPQGTVCVVLAARLLRDKGVLEYIKAAQVLKARGVVARFLLAGRTDPGNSTSLTDDELRCIHDEGIVEVLGYREDTAELFASSHIIVLPSYREGLPKVLIEAAASGRAVVTTDVPGCRDAIESGRTGLLVPVKNVNALANAIQVLIENPEKRVTMGAAARGLAEREFDIRMVIERHLQLYAELLQVKS